MPAPHHVLLPFAAAAAAGCREQLATLALPKLTALMERLDVSGEDLGNAEDLTMPHERVLARAAGVYQGDGLAPLAAWQLRADGEDPGNEAWGWIVPCHWHVGQDHIRMQPPQLLALDETDSRALLAAMQPYFEEDGLALRYVSPTAWLARGEPLRDLPAASVDRVSGSVINDRLPRGPQARTLRRLQQEMQMLLYTHPVNEAREAHGLAPVNSFWVGGTGALPPGARTETGIATIDALREPALAGDWPAWASAWRTLDAQLMPRLQEQLARGEGLTLTLCGESHARSYTPVAGGAWQRLTRLFRAAPPAARLLDHL